MGKAQEARKIMMKFGYYGELRNTISGVFKFKTKQTNKQTKNIYIYMAGRKKWERP